MFKQLEIRCQESTFPTGDMIFKQKALNKHSKERYKVTQAHIISLSISKPFFGLVFQEETHKKESMTIKCWNMMN